MAIGLDSKRDWFVIVDGSSGSGKTQSAFVLEGPPVMYFLLMDSDQSYFPGYLPLCAIPALNQSQA